MLFRLSKSFIQRSLIAFLIIGPGLCFHWGLFNDFPDYIHGWAQADRYALALNFLGNNFNLLEAETFIYNKEFPYNFGIPSHSTVSMVNPPIHEFIIASIMKLSNCEEPFVFRIYTFFWSLIGLFSLSRIGRLMGLKFSSQLVLLIMAATSPVFVYYQNNFLPSIPCLSLSILGLLMYLKYVKTPKQKWILLSFSALLISSICRSTFTIPLITISSIEIIRIASKNSRLTYFVIPFLTSAIIHGLLSLHSSNQVHEFGSVFLYYLVPASSFSEAIDLVSTSIINWFFDYFNSIQWILLAALFLFVVIRFNLVKKLDELHGVFWGYIGISLIGSLLFTIAMLNKFPNHDYYFLDTFFLLILLVFLFLLKIWDRSKFSNWKGINFIIIIFAILSYSFTDSNLSNRISTKHNYISSSTNHLFANSNELLDSLAISKNSNIHCLCPGPPNLPFIHLNRKGFYYPNLNTADWDKTLDWDFDYIISPQDYFYENFYSQRSDIIERLNPIYRGSKLMIAKYDSTIQTSEPNFFALDPEQKILEYQNNFEENKAIKFYSPFQFTGLTFNEGKQSAFLPENEEYGLLFLEDSLAEFKKGESRAFVQLHYYAEQLEGLSFVFSVQNKAGENLYYQKREIQDSTKTNQWNKFRFLFNIPRISEPEIQVKFYLWNRFNKSIYIDNFKLQLYSH